MFAYMKLYVRYVDALNRLVGRCVMYLVFAIMAILLFSSLSRTLFDRPVLWGVEMAQFVTTAYYLLGGGFALLMHSHARMDLFYGRLGARGRAAMDAVTVICLLTFLAFLLYGGISSTVYSIEFNQHNNTAWGPAVAPVKCFMVLGIVLTLLQAVSEFFKDIARVFGVVIGLDIPELLLVDGKDTETRDPAVHPQPALLTGQRVFGAIGFVGAVAGAFLWGTGGTEMAFNASMSLMNWFPMITLPLFIFMGYILSESGIANDLYRMFHVWMGPLPGGLAIGTVVLMVAISAMNGLSVAGMAIGATIALPEMLRRGYDKRMVSGVIQAGSSLGLMMPPSVVLVLYGMIARQPVNKLWLAGVGPALLFAVLIIAYIVIRCRLNPSMGPALPAEERAMPRAEKFRLLLAGLLPLAIIFSVTGFFLLGVTSLVESSAVGALAAMIAAALKHRLTARVLRVSLLQTLSVTCMFMWIMVAALCFSSVFDGLGAVHAIRRLFLEDWGLSPWGVLIVMQLSYLLMGMFLDDTAMLVIVAPLYIPLVKSLGFDPIWYGVLYTITCQIAYMTPPFGYNLFLMKAMAPKEITLADIYSSIIPFVGIMLVGLVLVMLFPGIAMYLPDRFL